MEILISGCQRRLVSCTGRCSEAQTLMCCSSTLPSALAILSDSARNTSVLLVKLEHRTLSSHFIRYTWLVLGYWSSQWGLFFKVGPVCRQPVVVWLALVLPGCPFTNNLWHQWDFCSLLVVACPGLLRLSPRGACVSVKMWVDTPISLSGTNNKAAFKVASVAFLTHFLVWNSARPS